MRGVSIAGGARVHGVALSAGVAAAFSVGAMGCHAAGYPIREPAAVLRPLAGEIDALLGELGGGRVVDGPTRVHCHPYQDADRSIEWRIFARSPMSAATPPAIDRALQARRSAGWIVDQPPPTREATFRLRRNGLYLRLSYLPSGAGDVVVIGESECFLPGKAG